MTSQNLQAQRPTLPFPEQQQPPKLEFEMNLKPDYGESSDRGSGKLPSQLC